MCFSPDGRCALSGSWDKTLRLWDIATGKCLRVLEGHANTVRAVCISPDGRYGLSGGEVRLVKPFTGNEHISRDDWYKIPDNWDCTLRLWNLATGECVRAFEEHSNSVISLSINPDGTLALCGGSDGLLKLWSLSTGECLRQFRWDAGDISSVCIRFDGRTALSCEHDPSLQLWDLTTGECLRTFEGHTESVSSVCISPDGRYGLSGSEDRTLRLWELATGRCLRTLEGHTDFVNSGCISPDGRYGLSGSWDKTLRLWRLAIGEYAAFSIVRPRPTAQLSAAERAFTSLIATSERALSGGHPQQAAILLQQARQLPGYERSPHALRLLNAASVKVGLARAWVAKELRGHAGAVSSVCISPDGRYGLSGSEDRTIRLWELATGRCLRTFAVLKDRVNSVCISPDGRYGLSGSSDGYSLLLELATGAYVRVLGGDKEAVKLVRFSPDGRHGLSVSSDNTFRLWELATGKCLRVIKGYACADSDCHRLQLHLFPAGFRARDTCFACVSPDGRYVLSGGSDSVLCLWELATGECCRVFTDFLGEVRSVCARPDCRVGRPGTWDVTLRQWELATGKCLRAFRGPHRLAQVGVHQS